MHWDPGRLTSPDADLISALSSLAIASSFPEDLVVVDARPAPISPLFSGQIGVSMMRASAASSGGALLPPAPAIFDPVSSGGGALLPASPPTTESIVLERGSLPPQHGGDARSPHPPLCRSDGGITPAGLASAPQRASSRDSLGTSPASLCRAAPGLSLLPPRCAATRTCS